MPIIDVQRRLQTLGLYSGQLDGVWGPASDNALDEVLDFYEAAHPAIQAPEPTADPMGMAWGAKVSPTFRDRVRWICNDPKDGLGIDPSWLMACMAWESGETFSAGVKNMAGSGAVGLIQFMPTTAKSLKTTTAELAAMTAEDQLRYVFWYLEPFKGRMHSLADAYMCILWPAAVGRPDDEPLPWSGITYRQNAGLDSNRDGHITKREAADHVYQKLEKGRQFAA